MSWQNIQHFRKTGQIQQAVDAAVAALAADPEDFKVRSQYEWVMFDIIKGIVANIGDSLKNSKSIQPRYVNDLMGWMETYYHLKPEIPGMACTSILTQLTKVGSHLPRFLGFINWIGPNGLRSEDWEPRQYQGKTYPSLAMNIARALCKWTKAHPQANSKELVIAMEWAEKVAKITQGDDALWLNWDRALLFRQMGDFQRAAEILASVIKAKRTEFWVWAEAGRLYRLDQPDLALACFCRALECQAEPKFMGRTHRDLAELLAEQGDHAQASQEVAFALDIHQAQGWRLSPEMQELMSSQWFDPAAIGSMAAKDFYAAHSSEALALCFDIVETKSASYLGPFSPGQQNAPQPGRKPRQLFRFAVKDAKGNALSIISPGMKYLNIKVGAPLTVVIGRQNGDDRQTIVHVLPRQDGQEWDCLEQILGVAIAEATTEKSMKFLILSSGEESRKCPLKSQLVMLAEFGENVVEVGLQGFGVAGLEGHPLVLDFAPEDLDAVELGAVGWQEVQGQALFFELLYQGRDRLGGVNRGVVQDDGQRLTHLFDQQAQETRKQLCGGVRPELGGEQCAGAEQGAEDVEPLAPHGCGGMALARWCPGTSVGWGERKPGLVHEDQDQLAALGLGLEFLDLGLGTAKSGVASFFLSEWRVRLYTKPSRFRACCTTQVLTLTLNASCSLSFNCGALRASWRAQSQSAGTCSAASLRGAPLRGASDSPAMPLASQVSRCAATVSRLSPCSNATVLMGLPLCSSNKVRARCRARQSPPRSTMWASCWRSASHNEKERGLRDMALS